MTTTFTAAFDVESWEEETFDEGPGARLFLIRVGKRFHGEVEGTSRTTLAAAISAQDDDDAGYGGVERLDVELAGLGRGTFVLRHSAIASSEERSMDVVVVPGTATGDLEGLVGTAHIDVAEDGAHTLTLTVERVLPS